MISGIVPFEEIVQSVKDETGIENIRPFYEKIRRLIFRAEREIGYGGSVVLIKEPYLFAGKTSADPNFSRYLKFPESFIEYEGIGQRGQQVSNRNYQITSEGLRFNQKQTEDTVLLYWGLKTNDEGYPIVTRNHEEAVVAYIVWKLYSSKIFLGIGNMNAKKDYENAFNFALLEARGDDAFPTLEQWNAIGQLSYTDRRTLIDQPVHSYNYDIDYEDVLTEEEVPIINRIVYYWVYDSFTDTINEIIPVINPNYLSFKNSKSLNAFSQLITLDNSAGQIHSTIGSICFAISDSVNSDYLIKDFLNQNITNLFDIHYYPDTKIKLYVSKTIYSYFSLDFKIEKL